MKRFCFPAYFTIKKKKKAFYKSAHNLAEEGLKHPVSVWCLFFFPLNYCVHVIFFFFKKNKVNHYNEKFFKSWQKKHFIAQSRKLCWDMLYQVRARAVKTWFSKRFGLVLNHKQALEAPSLSSFRRSGLAREAVPRGEAHQWQRESSSEAKRSGSPGDWSVAKRDERTSQKILIQAAPARA